MNVLGLAHDVWLSSAALIQNGKVVAAGCEERFNRQKLYAGFPAKAIEYCLREGRLTFKDIDCVAVGWNPARHMARPNRRLASASSKANYLVTVPNLLQQFAKEETEQVLQRFSTSRSKWDVVYVDHHMAHLANAFYLSSFKKAALLTMDGVGEIDTACMALGDQKGIHVLKKLKYPHSLGLFYGTFTSFLGFKLDSDEWKVMALAAFGKPRRQNPYYKKIKDLIRLEKGGFFELDLAFFNYYLQDEVGFCNDKLISVFGKPRQKNDAFSSRHYDIAAAVQIVFEETLAHCLNGLYRLTGGCEAVALSGGSFMNSVFNGKIHELTPFKRSFVSSCPDDSGVSIGAALSVYHANRRKALKAATADNYWGPAFSSAEIVEVLKKYNIPYAKVADIEKKTARLLAGGKLVGWFQGKMEFGQRALGNRSILADPRDKNMKNKVNMAVKYRETFRPFAPSTLEEKAKEYFEIGGNRSIAFMERVVNVRPQRRSVIPAVTHVDGSARLQTV